MHKVKEREGPVGLSGDKCQEVISDRRMAARAKGKDINLSNCDNIENK